MEAALAQLPPVSQRQTNAEWLAAQAGALGGRVCWAGEPLRGGIPAVALVAEPIRGVRDLAGNGRANHPDFYAGLRKTPLTELDAEARRRRTVLVCAEGAAARELLARELPPDTKVKLLPESLSEGFSLANLRLTVAAQGDLYPTTRSWRAAPRAKPIAGQRLEYAFDVEPGELVVHLEHGIGRFLGLNEIEVDGRRTEVFTLEYAGGAKLHVPTTHAHLLSRYIGPDSRKVKLHALDGKRWRNEKEAAQRGIEDLAAGLLETQARRRVMPGFAFDLSDPWIAEFEALFPWQETPDQTRVIAEVKRDMAAPTAMDRLLCGDAGYGKTEVAMRAAFIAVANHKQVALLAPTTVLAEQHFATFCDRMAHFPVRIEVLSRFRTRGQREKTRAAAKGQVDILIGTHALLTENIPFQDLGLLIIDEEQRFGVAHKERLKSLRALVDVLTMSATPIPRTLYLSLTGARDLEIRGSGNLLGAAQSGHIAAIGFGLYCQLLRRTVARLKGEALPTLVDVELDLDFLDASPGAAGPDAAAIPYLYVEDDAQRMNVYRRLAEAVSIPELDALQAELADRYGPPPPRRPPRPPAHPRRRPVTRIVPIGLRGVETSSNDLECGRLPFPKVEHYAPPATILEIRKPRVRPEAACLEAR